MGGGGSGADLIKGRQGGGLLQHFDAMERVVLTANGNLQRVIRLGGATYIKLCVHFASVMPFVQLPLLPLLC